MLASAPRTAALPARPRDPCSTRLPGGTSHRLSNRSRAPDGALDMAQGAGPSGSLGEDRRTGGQADSRRWWGNAGCHERRSEGPCRAVACPRQVSAQWREQLLLVLLQSSRTATCRADPRGHSCSGWAVGPEVRRSRFELMQSAGGAHRPGPAHPTGLAAEGGLQASWRQERGASWVERAVGRADVTSTLCSATQASPVPLWASDVVSHVGRATEGHSGPRVRGSLSVHTTAWLHPRRQRWRSGFQGQGVGRRGLSCLCPGRLGPPRAGEAWGARLHVRGRRGPRSPHRFLCVAASSCLLLLRFLLPH